ncbi:MAG: hypothetical protein IKT86_05550 [Bacteroidaceae bacterium]|nr:hypothetical protein [Bacteroidaceae bacterium]
MKRFGLVVLASLAVFMVGCGNSEVDVTNDEIDLKSVRSVQLQAEAPGRRAWGKGEDDINARANARVNYIYMLQSAVDAAMGRAGQRYCKAFGKENISESAIRKIAANVDNISTHIHYTDQYRICFQCIECRSSIEEIAESITASINEQLSDEEKLKMRFDYLNFKERLEKQLKKIKQNGTITSDLEKQLIEEEYAPIMFDVQKFEEEMLKEFEKKTSTFKKS